MPLSWNEIRARAVAFSKEWENENREDAEAKTFWDDFFHVFGLRRRHVAAFEAPVRKLSGNWGYIDLFLPGTMLAEHKSRGKDLNAANAQAMEYITCLEQSGRSDEVPRYVIVTDFEQMALHDLDANPSRSLRFRLGELHKHIHAFGFIPGYQQHELADPDPLNIEAAERLGALRDALEKSGYKGHMLERMLVRLLFCLFADKTGIFDPRDSFALYLQSHTKEDGSDLGPHIQQIFELLDTEVSARSSNVPEDLAGLPYVNGGLFGESLRIAHFDRKTRDALLHCTRFDWSAISPAIFGALFQSVLDDRERRQIGAHYTSERDIMKIVNALFLDGLRAEFEKIRKDRPKLLQFHTRLGTLQFLDPACGCGNFLVVAYRELRRLEIDVLQELYVRTVGVQQVTDVTHLARVDVDQFYGIEIEEWPARIAEVAMWLMDHQMNTRLAEVFGQYFVRLPLRKSPTIECNNALRIDWATVLTPVECNYVLGNPPFIGKKEQSDEQKADLEHVWGGAKGTGNLDYVTCWYRKAAAYIQGTRIRVAFVSTNSISQGEQVGVLWEHLFALGVKIHFAHTTFAWQSEARGMAHVHVVIIGFGAFDPPGRTLYTYATLKGTPLAIVARNINPYLTDAPDVVIRTRTTPLNGAPEIRYGSMMIDKDRKHGEESGLIIGGDDAKAALIAESSKLRGYIKRVTGGEEYINGTTKWCLWLVGAPPDVIASSPSVRKRIEGIRKFRLSSNREQTRKLASTPTLFGEIRQPSNQYLIIPKVSSETRRYVPIGFMQPEVIATGSALIVPGADLYHLGVLSSAMHNAWMRYVGGRMKSDYQYSNNIVYNNFPWPQSPSVPRRAAVSDAAKAVLEVRAKFASSSLAELYDPHTMPPELAKAHEVLDRAVEKCYRAQAFDSDRLRVEHLFGLYSSLTNQQATLPVKRTRQKRKT